MMSDTEDNLEHRLEEDDDDEEDTEGGGMRAAYSIGDLAGLDDDDGENPGEKRLTLDGRSQAQCADDRSGTTGDDPHGDGSAADHHDNDLSEANRHDNKDAEDAAEERGAVSSSLVMEKSSYAKGENEALHHDTAVLNEDNTTLNQDNTASNQDNKILSHDNKVLDENNLEVNQNNGASNEGNGVSNHGNTAAKQVNEDDDVYSSSVEIRERKRIGSKSESPATSDPSYANVGPNGDGSEPLVENNYETVYDDVADNDLKEKGGTLVPGRRFDENEGPQDDYENIEGSQMTRGLRGIVVRSDDEGWASSEFEEYEDSEDQGQSQKSQESLSQGTGNGRGNGGNGGGGGNEGGISKRMKRFWRKSNPSIETPSPSANPTMFEKVAARFSQRKRDGDAEPGAEESCVLEVSMNLEKHPPPQLPPTPGDISSLQLKRRHVVSTIIESEKSYMASLLRLVDDYEKPLLEAKPQIIQLKDIRCVFLRIRDILQCHNMFQIELAEVANAWDAVEKIGDVFTASFSKSMVFDVYSGFVVNFSTAMDTAKKQARKVPAFADFLKQKLEVSEDRLSLFGLMVKPVQRFPQFIMLLQDMLKFTPKDHHDRLSLQRALTELEALTDRLNEAKRESESRLEVDRLLRNLRGIYSFKVADDSYLVRQDDVIEIKQKNGEPTERSRRLFLLNDQLICTEVLKYEPGNTEKFVFQWSVPICDVDLIESNLPSNYTVQIAPGKTLVSLQKSAEKAFQPSENNPYKKELDDMIHDLSILQSMLQLTDQLRMKHRDFDSETIRILTRSLQTRIGQKCDIEHCLMTLSLPTNSLQVSAEKHLKGQVTKHWSKVGRSKSVQDEVKACPKVQFTFQFPAVILKHDWLQELQNTKLTTDPAHHPAWYTSESDQPSYKNPHFHNPLLLDITKEDCKVQCATYVTLPSVDDLGVGVQHLWVCNGDKSKGQVSIVSLHTNQPCVVESFKVCDSLICCAESVPAPSGAGGLSHGANGDTVWMGTEDKKIIICKVLEDDRSAKRLTISTDSIVSYLKYLNGKVFAGTRNGSILIYFCQDGNWNLKQPLKQSLGGARVSCLLPINQEIWASTNLTIHKLNVAIALNKTKSISKESHELASDFGQIECMVKAGVGLMVAFSNRAVIRLYHLETLQHLQDINIASAITPLLEGKQLVSPFSEDRKLYSLSITFLLSGHGLLWVGTNYGFILTLPLPRLEGVPQVKRRPVVSFHAHSGPVKFLAMVNCGNTKVMTASSRQAPSGASHMLENIENRLTAGNDELGPVRLGNDTAAVDDDSVPEDTQLTSSGEGVTAGPNGVAQTLTRLGLCISTPELANLRDSEDESDVCSLYGNLLKGVDADMDSELIQGCPPLRRHRAKGANYFQSNVSNRVSKISNAVRRNFGSSAHSHQSSSIKYHSVFVPNPPANYENVEIGVGATTEGSTQDESHRISPEGGDAAQSTTEGAVELPVNQGLFEKSAIPDEKPTVAPPSDAVCFTSAAAPVSSSRARRLAQHSKRLVVISGGEGHVNWKEKKPFDKSYEDICLLLWKC